MKHIYTTVDYGDQIHLAALVGSKAYELDTDGSDDDWRGFYALPTHFLFIANQPPEQIKGVDPTSDEDYWEVRKFIRLALNNNPNALEVLWSPKMLMQHPQTQPVIEKLVMNRQSFLSKLALNSHGGYALNQWSRGLQTLDKDEKVGWKMIMHTFRLLIEAIQLAKTGILSLDMASHRSDLLDIRMGKWALAQAAIYRDELEKEFREVQISSQLPDYPDRRPAHQFLIEFYYAITQPLDEAIQQIQDGSIWEMPHLNVSAIAQEQE